MVWLVAAAAKLRDRASTRDSIRKLVGCPAVLAPVIAVVLPIVEAVLGVLMLAAVSVRLVAATSAPDAMTRARAFMNVVLSLREP